MRNLSFLIFALIINLSSLPEIFADSSTGAELVLKKIEVTFEPSHVELLEELRGGELRRKELPFRVLKDRGEAVGHKYLVAMVGEISKDASPLAVLLVSSQLKAETIEATSSLINKSDLVDASLIALARARILELRAKFAALDKNCSNAQSQVNALKAKAASLARLNRLVEAQNTAVSLNRKLEGLLSDKSNISLLLDIVRKEQPSARLASTEAALSRDLRLLSQEGAGAKKQKDLLLSDSQREAAEDIIERASGLNLESLREKVRDRRSQLDRVDGVYADSFSVEDAKELADEYNRKHNKNGALNSDGDNYLRDPAL